MADPLPYPPRMNFHFLPNSIKTLRSPRLFGETLPSFRIQNSVLSAPLWWISPFVLRLQEHSKIENRKSKMIPRSHCVHAPFTLFHAILQGGRGAAPRLSTFENRALRRNVPGSASRQVRRRIHAICEAILTGFHNKSCRQKSLRSTGRV